MSQPWSELLKRAAQEQHPGVEMELATSSFESFPKRNGSTKRMRGRLLQARAELANFVRNAGWSFDVDGCYVYLLWGTDNRCPLYVGRSTNLIYRLANHRSDPEKREVVRVQVIPCVDFDYMVELELRLIWVYQPPFNKAGKTY